MSVPAEEFKLFYADLDRAAEFGVSKDRLQRLAYLNVALNEPDDYFENMPVYTSELALSIILSMAEDRWQAKSNGFDWSSGRIIRVLSDIFDPHSVVRSLIFVPRTSDWAYWSKERQQREYIQICAHEATHHRLSCQRGDITMTARANSAAMVGRLPEEMWPDLVDDATSGVPRERRDADEEILCDLYGVEFYCSDLAAAISSMRQLSPKEDTEVFLTLMHYGYLITGMTRVWDKPWSEVSKMAHDTLEAIDDLDEGAREFICETTCANYCQLEERQAENEHRVAAIKKFKQQYDLERMADRLLERHPDWVR